jgi:extracellular factor (EF) 3-hydroxypalmitic acid methyl ester biosynthesis protein
VIERDTIISCRNSQGAEIQATPVRLNRFAAVFEVYNPYSILQLSEVLLDFRISIGERLVYSGRAVVSNLVNAGIMLVCEAALEESWLDVDLFSPLTEPDQLRNELSGFMREAAKIHAVSPEFKIVVADMHSMFTDLRRWLEQVELGLRSLPTNDLLRREQEIIAEIGPPVGPAFNELFVRFEAIAGAVDISAHAMHRTYMRRLLHPLVLCAPFAYRTFQKPLGYAGDYLMVNMILSRALEGGSLFAKAVHAWFLTQAPAEAHRNRIAYLRRQIVAETTRAVAAGRRLRIFNLGCGPAGEVQQCLAEEPVCDAADFTLVDFNDETLEFSQEKLTALKQHHQRATGLTFQRKSVHQILKESARIDPSAPQYDLVYCAGLFDYLSDRICQRLVNIFYDMLAPGGLLIVTNVDSCNPARNGMEFLLEWHLIHRDREQLKRLHPLAAPPGAVTTQADVTGVNIYLEVRKPGIA